MAIDLNASIVRVLKSSGATVGAGFLVSADGLIATCAHVVTASLDLREGVPETPTAHVHLDFPLVAPGQTLQAQVVVWRPEVDVAGLKLVQELPMNARSVRLVRADDLWGHSFRAFGFPSGYDDGIWASGVLRERQAAGWMQIEDVKQPGFRVQPGFSGGPAWDDDAGGVVGMIVAADRDVESKAAFIIPVDVLVRNWPALEAVCIESLISARSDVSPPPEPVRAPRIEQFVGREAELAYFGEQLATSRFVAITGMAGVGKTALAATLARRVAEPERIFWHTFREGEGVDAPLWRLAGFLAWHGREDVWRMLQGAQTTGGRPPPIKVLLDYLLQMLRGRGFLLCFDDLHCVDDDPLLAQFVERLRQAVREGELALVVTSRHEPAFLETYEFEALEGLSFADTCHLLAGETLSLAEDLIERLHTQTQGNAQLLTLAVNALKRTQDPEHLIDRITEAPDIERFLMREVDGGLAEEEREVMQAVAVLLGFPGTRDAIEAVLEGEGIRRVLHDLSSRYLLAVSEGERGIEYGQHAMVQAFYYDMLGRRERQAKHRKAAAYYEGEGRDVLKAVRHYQRAGEQGRAAELATADVGALINQGQARELVRLLERFEPGQVDAAEWAKINMARGQVWALFGERVIGCEGYQNALAQLAELPDSPTVRELRARACRGMGDTLQYESPQEALAWIQRGLEELEGASAREEAALHIKAGSAQIALGNYDAALRELEQGLKLLPEDPSHLRASALAHVGTVHFYRGDVERGKAYTLQALEIAQRLNDYYRMLAWLHNLGTDKEISGDWDGAAADYQQALALAKRLGDVTEQTTIENSLGMLRTKQGQGEPAMAHLTRALELAHSHSSKEGMPYILSSLAGLQLALGKWQTAGEYLNEAEQVALEIDAKYPLADIYCGLARMELGKQQPQAALRYAGRAVDQARELGLDLEEGIGLRILGQALLADGQREPALTAFQDSLSILEGLDPYEAARTKMVWGLDLACGDDAGDGKRLLGEARATFERLGARRDLGAVEEALRT